jgi:phosphopantetheine--protein transferase-like protein
MNDLTSLSPGKIKIINDRAIAKDDYSFYLTKSEIETINHKPIHKRHLSVAGRVAVKEIIKNTHKPDIDFQSIEIFNTPSGVPIYKINNKLQKTKISISHCKDVAIGGILDKANGFGIDVEKIRYFNESFIKSFISDAEWSQYKKFNESNQKILGTLIWSIKEATLKALGLGLRLHPKNIEVIFNEKLMIKKILVSDCNLDIEASWTLHRSSYIIATIGLYEKS